MLFLFYSTAQSKTRDMASKTVELHVRDISWIAVGCMVVTTCFFVLFLAHIRRRKIEIYFVQLGHTE